MPALRIWIASPLAGISTTTVVCARFAISTSLCPAPTVSTNTRSIPSASSTLTASNVASARPPGYPRVAMLRMNTSGSSDASAIRTRSPRIAPPVNGLDGSTAITPTFRPRFRNSFRRRAMSVLLPVPGGPVSPMMCAFPGWRRTSRAVPASRPTGVLLEEVDDVLERGARPEHALQARLLELRDVLGRNDAAARDDDVRGFLLLQDFHDAREERHVRAAEGT